MVGKVDVVEQRLNGHEELCALRHNAINSRLGRIEYVMITIAGTGFVGLGTVLYQLMLTKGLVP